MIYEKYFANFSTYDIEVEPDVFIHTVVGGTGDTAVLLLHGHPESHLIWRFLAPKLAENYTVVMTDLRGYGDSSKPIGLADHSNYSNRVMANDQVAVMKSLGFEQFHLIGHDRGARVSHRLALDHEEKLHSLCMMDILPTDDMYDGTTAEFAMKYYHWFFYTQPVGFPERLLAADPAYFIEFNLNKKVGEAGRANFTDDVLAEYTRHFSDPKTIHGICEDYRASATIDRRHNDVDRTRIMQVPTLVLWGADGIVAKIWDVMDGWRPTIANLQGMAVENCGHFVPEEQPAVVWAEVHRFLSTIDTKGDKICTL